MYSGGRRSDAGAHDGDDFPGLEGRAEGLHHHVGGVFLRASVRAVAVSSQQWPTAPATCPPPCREEVVFLFIFNCFGTNS